MKARTMKLGVKSLSLTVLAGVMLWASAAHAQVVHGSDTFQVTANVLGACTVSANDLNFGNYNAGGGAVDVDTSIVVTCTNLQLYEVGIDAGLNLPTATTRAMAGGVPAGGTNLDYELFQDPARTVVWGDVFGINTVSRTGTGLPQLIQVHGQIPGGQIVNPGAFSDTATVTVLF